MSERQLYLKPPEEGGSSRYYHAGYGVGASRRDPYITVQSDAAAAALLDTGKFEEVDPVSIQPADDSEAEDEDDESDAAADAADAAEDESEDEAAEAGSEDAAEDEDADEICGTEMSDGTVCERPPDECPYH